MITLIHQPLAPVGDRGWASCSHAELLHKEEEAPFLLVFGTKFLAEEDWPGDCCTLCWSLLVPCLPYLELHGMLWAVAEWNGHN